MQKLSNKPPTKEKYIETPEKLLGFWNEYKAWTNANPIRVQDFVGKDGEEVYRLKQRPLTQQRFETWVWNLHGITIGQYFDNPDNRYAAYIATCSHIRAERQADQIEGGMAGIYNPSITQRLNNLVEKIQEDGSKEVTIKVKYERKANKPE